MISTHDTKSTQSTYYIANLTEINSKQYYQFTVCDISDLLDNE